MRNRNLLGRYLQPFLFALLLTLSLPVQADDELDELRRLASSGAVQLTLKLFEQHAPDLADDATRWAAWERARQACYVEHNKWALLIDHIDGLPPGIPDDIHFESETRRAEALLALNRPARARTVLRRLLWQQARTAEQIANWRQLLIRSYLREGSAKSANIAMLRYEQDYGKTATNDNLLRARVLLLAGQEKAAADLLSKQNKPVARATWLLASLRSADLPAKKIITLSKKELKNKKLTNPEKLRFYAVIAEASRVEGDSGQRIAAIEDMFSLTRTLDIDDGLFRYDADMLWQAYEQHALKIANSKQLLVGDDAAWLNEIQTYSKNPLRQRAMYAWLARNATDIKRRSESNERLVALLQKRKNGIEIIRHLYTDALKGDSSEVPAIVGYVLIDQALNESDIKLASRLLVKLVAPPEGVDQMLWHLRRARVFVLAGEHDKGIKVLYRLLSSQDLFSKQQTDRFMQVIFDLQTVERHAEAFDVFKRLYNRSPDLQLRREILYWMADSKKALKEYEQASQLYLRSARSPLAVDGIDLWGQSAYYQAVDAISKAGFIDDARSVYNRLLSVTKDPGRRAVLNREIQQLLLKQQVVNKERTNGSAF
jgi:hypothetical protein